jgi:DNA-binding NarL/FixJ family response regulator
MRPSAFADISVHHADAVVAEGLAVVLREANDFRVSLDRTAGATALVDAADTSSAVFVTDYVSGIAAVRHFNRSPFRGGSHQPRVMVVTSRERESDIRLALRVGILGYWLQGSPVDELTWGLRLLARGSRYVCKAAAERLADSPRHAELTRRERDVLERLVEGSTNAEIARRVGVATGTVKAHVRNIFEKLSVHTRTQAAAIATERGLALPIDTSTALMSFRRSAASGAVHRSQVGDFR